MSLPTSSDLEARLREALQPTVLEVIDESADKEDAAADLALIGAAQRVEHYEISGYTTARNLALQLRQTAIVALLSKSLAEEENADQLLNQVARSLMSVAKMPAAVERTADVEAEPAE